MLLSFTEFKEDFNAKTNFLVYHGLVTYIELSGMPQKTPKKPRNFSTFVENLIKAPKPNRLVCEKRDSAKQSSLSKSQEKWSADCSLQCFKTIDWEMAYKLPFCSTKATKLIIFQFKLLYRYLATKVF